MPNKIPVSEPVIKSRALNPDANDFLYNPIRNEEDRMPALINKKIIRIMAIADMVPIKAAIEMAVKKAMAKVIKKRLNSLSGSLASWI